MKAFSRHVRVEPLNRRKKDSLYRKNISGRGWQVGTRDRVPYNNSGNREKPFRGTGHSNNNITVIVLCLSLFYARRYFVTALKLAFLSVITGRSCCLVTNQCCHFWSFNARSVVLREICEVWCIADKFDLDWAQLVLFPRFLCFRDARKLYSYF